MTLVHHGHAGSFRFQSRGILATRPDLHTMLLSGLGTIEQLRAEGEVPPTVLGWWREPDETATTAAFVWMPPHTSLITP
ncbi:hypothetical protein [Streptomyces nigra]|uniref:hypothetical protein n=1 Tax=Streptomyces nigra TaxID=1827580 RepID=UPI000D52A0A8|nr:hypothetical protein [Streptomyces nigra]AWE48301.1 hypothetical protein DC008_00240 [Streptomyces nigra]